MHTYLRSIGFSDYKKDSDVEVLLDELQKEYMNAAIPVACPDGLTRLQIRAHVSQGMGIAIEGYINYNGSFVRQLYFPYLLTTDASTTVPITVHKRVDAESFSGLGDDSRLGITLIFKMINTMTHLERTSRGIFTAKRTITFLSSFCDEGKVLLPVQKTPKQKETAKGILRHRHRLIEAARNGDQNAMEALATEDMQTFNQINQRLNSEDIYSIVDTVFMPQGVECDIYQVIGDIIAVREAENDYTGEKVYDLTVSSNDLVFHVGILQADLEGEPKPGRRFKGRIWMQGRVEFAD